MRTILIGLAMACIALPAWANGDDYVNGMVAGLQSDAARAKTEEDRVDAIRPMPQTDNALCAAESKVIVDAEFLVSDPFTGQQNPAGTRKAIQGILDGAIEIAGAYHCPR
jgi:hypothetical protein